jgi:hypothetical protein
MYKLISVGFNDQHGRKPLSFAEKDATDVAKAFVGDLGPVASGDETVLVGSDATRENIRGAFATAASSDPRYLAFYFSGHGNEDGFLTASGLFPYAELRKTLGWIDVPYSMVILDVCKAASFLRKEAATVLAAVPDVSWMDALGNATPGTRCFFSTGADRLAGENSSTQNGAFTTALLAGMRFGRAELDYGASRFVSDEDAFNYARRHMKVVQKLDQIPEVRGSSGDFPMLRSERFEWIGDASITKATVLPYGLNVTALISDRVFVGTRFRYEILNCASACIYSSEQVLVPASETDTFTGTLPFDANWLKKDSKSCLAMILNGRTEFWWKLSLLDGVGDTLDERYVRAVYPARG